VQHQRGYRTIDTATHCYQHFAMSAHFSVFKSANLQKKKGTDRSDFYDLENSCLLGVKKI
jgi:hypothetical protein